MNTPLRVFLSSAWLAVITALTTLIPCTEAQLRTPFMSTWVQASGRFFKLDADGSHALIERNLQGIEDFVLITTDGKQEKLIASQPAISASYYRFDLSADAHLMAFGSGGNAIYLFNDAGQLVNTVYVPTPNAQPDQLVLSEDGKWIACTAWRFQQQGSQYRRVDSLFVVATDGSAVHTITPQPLLLNMFPFSFSLDGRKIAWIDNVQQGPMLADRDGQNAIRLPLPPVQDSMRSVYLDATASRLYYNMLSATTGYTLWSYDLTAQTFAKLDTAPSNGNGFEASRDGRRVRADLGTSSELVKENGREPMFTSSLVKIYGSWAWSHDGNVFVWRDDQSPYFNPVMLWKNSLGFGSAPPFRPGSTIRLELRAPGRAGDAYQMALSMATSPMLQDPKTGLIIPLSVDPLFLVSVQPGPLFHQFSGVLDAQGLAQASATVPAHPILVGSVYYAAFVTYQAGRIQYVSDEVRIEIE